MLNKHLFAGAGANGTHINIMNGDAIAIVEISIGAGGGSSNSKEWCQGINDLRLSVLLGVNAKLGTAFIAV
jgi:hypothetical protein